MAHPVTPSDAQRWFEEYNGYDVGRKRWTNTPHKPDLDKRFYTPIETLLGDIVKAFKTKSQPSEEHVSGQHSKTRKVEATFDQSFYHTTFKSSPDICIFGTGPSATVDAKIGTVAAYS